MTRKLKTGLFGRPGYSIRTGKGTRGKESATNDRKKDKEMEESKEKG